MFVMDIQRMTEFSFLASSPCTCTLDSSRDELVASALTLLRETNAANGYTAYKSV